MTVDCALCGGHGTLTLSDADDGSGHYTLDAPCSRCHGSGEEPVSDEPGEVE